MSKVIPEEEQKLFESLDEVVKCEINSERCTKEKGEHPADWYVDYHMCCQPRAIVAWCDETIRVFEKYKDARVVCKACERKLTVKDFYTLKERIKH